MDIDMAMSIVIANGEFSFAQSKRFVAEQLFTPAFKNRIVFIVVAGKFFQIIIGSNQFGDDAALLAGYFKD